MVTNSAAQEKRLPKKYRSNITIKKEHFLTVFLILLKKVKISMRDIKKAPKFPPRPFPLYPYTTDYIASISPRYTLVEYNLSSSDTKDAQQCTCEPTKGAGRVTEADNAERNAAFSTVSNLSVIGS